jgi:hypothetical protein
MPRIFTPPGNFINRVEIATGTENKLILSGVAGVVDAGVKIEIGQVAIFSRM